MNDILRAESPLKLGESEVRWVTRQEQRAVVQDKIQIAAKSNQVRARLPIT